MFVRVGKIDYIDHIKLVAEDENKQEHTLICDEKTFDFFRQYFALGLDPAIHVDPEDLVPALRMTTYLLLRNGALCTLEGEPVTTLPCDVRAMPGTAIAAAVKRAIGTKPITLRPIGQITADDHVFTSDKWLVTIPDAGATA